MKRSHAGFTLVEVVVAMFVLAVVFAGAAATVIAVTGVVQVNESRATSSNVLQSEVERLRSIPFDDLENVAGTTTTREVELDGRLYQVETTVSFADLEVDADRCTVTIDDDQRQLLKVDVAAWPQSLPSQRTSTTTTVARPPLDGLSPGSGSMTVVVLDHQDPPEPVESVWVELIRDGEVGPFRTQITGAEGCVLFHDVPGQGPTSTGNYTVRVYKPSLANPTYVSMQDESVPLRAASILAAGTNTTVEVRYAPEASFTPISVVPGGPVTDVELPEALQVSIERAGSVRTGANGGEISPVWPGIWHAWAGTCPAADPMGVLNENEGEGAVQPPIWEGASRGDPIVADGPTALEVPIAVIRLIDPQPTPQPLFAGRTLIRATDRLGDGEGGDCILTFDFTRDAAAPGSPNESVLIGLPFGDWYIEVLDGPQPAASTAAEVELVVPPNALDEVTDATVLRMSSETEEDDSETAPGSP